MILNKKLDSIKSFTKSKLWISILIYTFAITIRIINLEKASIYSDEITWIVRGKELIYAIIHKNQYFFENIWWKKINDTEAIALPLTFFNGLSQFLFAGSGKYSLKIFNDVLAARLPVVIISSFLPAFIYYLTADFLSKKVALISSIFYAVNPIALSFDRLVVNDSFLALFSFIALAGYINQSEKKKISIVPGIFLTLAFLTKPNGILPIFGWLAYLIYSKNKIIAKKQLIFNLIIFLTLTTIIWPESHKKPVIAIFEYIYNQFYLVQSGMTVFYKGKVTKNPGLDFYFIQYLIRTPEILIIGFLSAIIISIYLTYKRKLKLEANTLSIIAYNIIFFILISISAKKLGIRYSLPLLPWFIIYSSWGIKEVLKLVKNKKIKISIALVITIAALAPLTYNPDYYFYYNTIVGGPKGAQKYDMVGFCASSKSAAEYLQKENVKEKVFVLGCPEPIRYYSNLDLTYNYKEAKYIIVETYIKKQHPESQLLDYLKDKKLIKEIKFKNATIAEIYKI